MHNQKIIAPATKSVCLVVITYQPDLSKLSALLEAYQEQCEKLLVVDNGSNPSIKSALAQLVADFKQAQLLNLPTNLGIAAASNRGAQLAFSRGADYVLFSDQDSLPAPDLVNQLLITSLENPQLGAVGPVITDERGDDLLVYVSTKWGPRRAAPAMLAAHIHNNQPLPAAFLLASGCLVSKAHWQAIGDMRTELFIDHVDLEWGLRAQQTGYPLAVAPGAKLKHELGEATVKIPGRRGAVHIHSPIRCYYLTRNTIWLCKSSLLNRQWKLGYLIWLGKFGAFNILMVAPRWKRAHLMLRAVGDALRGHFGKF